MSENLSFRPITDDDMDYLYGLYASTRADEMAMLTQWSDEEKENFVQMQFKAQHQHYQEHFRHAAFDLILVDGEPIGRLYVDRREDEHRVVDITLSPEHCGKGIGGRIMRDVLDEAATANKMVRIHVEKNNVAMRLYERLGFKQVEDTGVYYLMERAPE